MTTVLLTRLNPIGDSITAQNAPVNYMVYLEEALTEAGYNVRFVGSQNGPPPIYHDGYPGAKIVDLDLADYVEASPADIILLHAGTNDIASTDATGGETADRLEAALEELHAAAPWALVVVMQIIPFGPLGLYATLDFERAIYDGLIPSIVARRQAAGQRVTYVDCATDYDLTWFQDAMSDPGQLHPSEDGARFMAAQVYPVVAAEAADDRDAITLPRGTSQQLLADAIRMPLTGTPRPVVLPGRGEYHLQFTVPARFKQGGSDVAVTTTTGTPSLAGQWWSNVRAYDEDDRYLSVVATDEDGYLEIVPRNRRSAATLASPAFDPTMLDGLVDWHRGDLGLPDGISDGGEMTVWYDLSGNDHHLVQGTSARRPLWDADGVNGLPCIATGEGDSAKNRWMDWSPNWAHTEDETMFIVLRYIASPTLDYQIVVLGVAAMSRYIANNNTHKPMIYDGAVRAQWSTALVSGSDYLIKWATEDLSSAKKFYTQVGDDTEVSETPGGTVAADSFNSLGMDTGVVTSQDLHSRIAEIIVYNRRLTPAEEAQIRAYIVDRYGIAM